MRRDDKNDRKFPPKILAFAPRGAISLSMQPISHVLEGLNPLAVAASTVAMLLVTVLWHSRFFFGRAWIRLSGIRPGDVRPAEAQRRVIYTILMAFFSAILLGCVSEYANTVSTLISMVVFLWLFLLLEQLNGFIWRREPFALFLLQTFRSLFALLAGALVFTFWS